MCRPTKPEFFACNSLVSYIGAPLLVKDQWLAIGLLGAGFTSYEIEFFGSLMTRSLIALNAILSPILALRTAPWDNSGQVLENGFNFSRRRQRKSAPPELTLQSQGYKSARRYRAASSAWCGRKGLNDLARLSPYGPVAVPMRIVGRIQQRVVELPPNGVGNSLFAAFDAEEDTSAFNVLARQLGEIRRFFRPAFLHFLVKTIHHIGHPADPGFEISDTERRKTFEHAADDRRDQGHHLFGGMINGVRRKKFSKALAAERAGRGAHVKSQAYVEPRSGSVDRVIAVIAKVGHLRNISRENSGHRAALGDGASEFLRCSPWVLRRQERDEFQSRRVCFAEVVNPIVEGSCKRRRKITLVQVANV